MTGAAITLRNARPIRVPPGNAHRRPPFRTPLHPGGRRPTAPLRTGVRYRFGRFEKCERRSRQTRNRYAVLPGATCWMRSGLASMRFHSGS